MRANWIETAGMWISDLRGAAESSALFNFLTNRCRHVNLRRTSVYAPQMPEEEVSYLAVSLGALQQEVGEGAVIVRLVTQHLHQL